MSIEIKYLNSHPEGFTDDLGIIADRNQYVPGRPGGWHIYNVKEFPEVREWLDDNNIHHTTYYTRIVLFRKEDVVLFQLRWA